VITLLRKLFRIKPPEEVAKEFHDEPHVKEAEQALDRFYRVTPAVRGELDRVEAIAAGRRVSQ
jgi:hypothetical protein